MSTISLTASYIGYSTTSGSSWIATTSSSPEWYAGHSSVDGNTYVGRLEFKTGDNLSSSSAISVTLTMSQTSNPGYVRAYLCSTSLTPSQCKSVSSVTGSSGYIATLMNSLSSGNQSAGTSVTWTADTTALKANTTYYVYFLRKGVDSNGFCAFKTSVGISVTYTARFAVTYNANGGSGGPSTQYKIEGTKLTLSSTKPNRNSARTGSYTVSFDANGGSSDPENLTANRTTAYSFKIWNTNKAGTGKDYSPGATYSTDAALTLYAIWNTLTTTSPVTLPSAITKEGTSASGYTVTFNANGGTCQTTTLTVTDTTTYVFDGWNTNSSGTGDNYDAESKYSPPDNVTLYAKWTSQVVKGSVTLPIATRTGYAFAGWAVSDAATSGVTGSYTPTENVTLYAVWSAEGLAYIDNGTSVEAYQIFIDNGTGWDQYVPYVDNGSNLELYS